MESFLAGLEATSIAQFLRVSRWGYAGVNATHIFGIALLVGAILPLNLRLLGFWPGVPISSLARILVPSAAVGLLIAVSAGALLFSVRATEYATLGVFKLKLMLIALGLIAALELHRAYGMSLDNADRTRLTAHALASMACWMGALVCGRLIAFAAD